MVMKNILEKQLKLLPEAIHRTALKNQGFVFVKEDGT